MKCGEKLGKFIDMERGLKGKSTESKIAELGSRFAEKSMSEVDRNFQKRKLGKTEIEIESMIRN